MKNTLADVNTHLIASLEQLSDPSVKDDDLKQAISRGKAIASVANTVISNARLMLDAHKFMHEEELTDTEIPEILVANKPTKLPSQARRARGNGHTS